MPSARADHLGRAAAAVALAATVLVTWPLWGAHATPPVLPAVDDLGRWTFGRVLLVLCGLAVVAPRIGAVALAVVVVAALLGDQLRWQPEVLSLTLLTVALSLGPRGRAVGRWHLGTMWVWAGLHKALSLGWSTGGALFIADSLHRPWLRVTVAYAVPTVEIALGLASFVPRLWRFVRWGAVALHLGILVTLSPLFADWNEAVWAWNAGLAAVGWLLFRPDPEERVVPDRTVGAIAALLLVTPALFYVGRIDAYLAHNLYSSNTPQAVVCDAAQCRSIDAAAVAELRVPVPPEPRLFHRLFEADCTPGDRLTIIGRATRFDDPPAQTSTVCPAAP